MWFFNNESTVDVRAALSVAANRANRLSSVDRDNTYAAIEHLLSGAKCAAEDEAWTLVVVWWRPYVAYALTMMCLYLVLLLCNRLLKILAVSYVYTDWGTVLHAIHWCRVFTLMFVASFMLGVCWNYCHAYERAVAKKRSQLVRAVLDGHPCSKRSGGGFSSFLRDLAHALVLTTSADDDGDTCQQYAQAMYVDALWETSPSSAFTTTVAHLVLDPLKLSAEAINYAFRALFVNIPLAMAPFLGAGVLYVITLTLMVMCGYTIWTPLFQLGPTSKVCDITPKSAAVPAVVVRRVRTPRVLYSRARKGVLQT